MTGIRNIGNLADAGFFESVIISSSQIWDLETAMCSLSIITFHLNAANDCDAVKVCADRENGRFDDLR